MAAAVLSVNVGQASAAGAGYTASLVQTPAAGSALAVDSATNTIYLATNSGVIVVNGATNTVTTTISTPAPVNAIAVDSATNTIYLAASPITSGPVIDVINGASNTVTASISVPIGITSLAVDSTTNTVFAAEPGLAQVAVIDGATNTITNVATGTGTRPYRLAVDQSTDTVWAADPNGRLIGIDGATKAISTTPLVGTEPISLAVNEGTDTIYVGDYRNDQVIVLDGKTDAVITDIAVGPALYGLDVDQSSGVVYASAGLTPVGTTWVINGSTNEIEDSIGRGSTGVVVDQATGVVYEPAQRQAAIFSLTAGATANAMSPVITSAGSTGFIVGEAGISFTVTSSALPAASITETGSLPPGVTMSASGVLSGTPSAGSGGLYRITITASNGIAPDFTQQFSLNVYEAPAITSGDSATFEVGTAGSFSLTATGYQAPNFTSAGSLPAGLSISDQTPGGWQISGTPAVGTGGVYPLTILAYNGVGSEAQQAFTLTVKEAPSFKSTPKATFVAGTSGSFQVSASGYPEPTYTGVGALPAGLALSSSGLLTGTPAAGSGGVYQITITATNGISPSASQAFTLTVDQAPAFTSARSATFKAGHWRRFIFRTTGFPSATLSERGRLPTGVRFRARSDGTALLAGRASRADRGKTYVITVIARNGVGPAVRETFRLKVA